MAVDEQKKELLPETGEWWLEPWWEDDNWIDLSGYDIKEVQQSIEVLKEYFPANWALSYRGSEITHILLRNTYFGKSIYQHDFLVRFGMEIEQLKDVGGFSSIHKRLQSQNENESAAMELSIGALFDVSGLQLEFPVPKPSKGKTPDLLVKEGTGTVAIECKQLSTSIKTRWRFGFYQILDLSIRKGLEKEDRLVKLIFEDIDIDNYFGSNGMALEEPHGAAETTADDAVENILRELTDTQSPIYFGVPGVVSGRFISKGGSEEVTSYIPDIKDSRVFGRIFSNGINRAASQLSSVDCPGVAFIYHEDLPDYFYAMEEFNKLTKNNKKYKNVAAILIFQGQPLLGYRAPYLLINKYSKYRYDDLEISKIVEDRYVPVRE